MSGTLPLCAANPAFCKQVPTKAVHCDASCSAADDGSPHRSMRTRSTTNTRRGLESQRGMQSARQNILSASLSRSTLSSWVRHRPTACGPFAAAIGTKSRKNLVPSPPSQPYVSRTSAGTNTELATCKQPCTGMETQARCTAPDLSQSGFGLSFVLPLSFLHHSMFSSSLGMHPPSSSTSLVGGPPFSTGVPPSPMPKVVALSEPLQRKVDPSSNATCIPYERLRVDKSDSHQLDGQKKEQAPHISRF